MAENNKTENDVNAKALEEISNPSPLVVSPNEAAAAAAAATNQGDDHEKNPGKENNSPRVVEEPSPQVIEGAHEIQPCQAKPTLSTSAIQEPAVKVLPDSNVGLEGLENQTSTLSDDQGMHARLQVDLNNSAHDDDATDGCSSLPAATPPPSSSSPSMPHDSHPSADPPIDNNSLSDDEPLWLMGVNVRPKRKRDDVGFKLFGEIIGGTATNSLVEAVKKPALLPFFPTSPSGLNL